ncbi:MAG TPA: hypothetical protein ACN46O_06700 [Prochlorococcus sp.]
MKPPVRHPKSAALASSLLALFAVFLPFSGRPVGAVPLRTGWHPSASAPLSVRLQQALNTPGGVALSDLLAGEYASDLESRFRIFSARFPDARWSVNQAKPLLDGRPTFEVVVSGTLNSGGLTYALEASQRLVLQSEGERIIGEEVISEQSILSSASKPLPISLLIPDAVLTGSRYDVDVVLDRPLGNAMVAGGLIGLTPVQVSLQSTPEIQLSPMHGGGLFKSVQAPFTPGSQTWAVMLVHPDGLITVTKRVRVVSNEEELTL